MDLETQVLIPAQVMSRPVGNEIVLLDLARGTYFGLEGVGKRIWESLADGKTIEETVAIIIMEYNVDDARAQQDVINLATDLVKRGLLEVR